MTTWRGKPKKFTVEVSGPGIWGLEYRDVEFNWEFNTTSDILCVFNNGQNDIPPKFHSKEWAAALLYTLADWYSRYEGLDELKLLLKEPLREKA